MRAPVPRVARAVLSVVAPRDQRAWVLADLDEEAALRAAADGMQAARAWSTRQVLTSVIPLLAQRSQSILARTWRIRMTIWRGMTTDISIALRRMRGAPVFTLICLLTLGLGIGGTTAVFTLIDQVLVASLPVARPTELIRIGDTDNCCVTTGMQRSFSLFSYDLYRQLRDRTPEFSDLAAFQAQPVSVSVRSVSSTNPPEAFVGELVSGNYFQTFGLSPALGRLLLPSDDRPDSPPVVVLSHRAWLQRFAGDPRIVGAIFAINGIPSEVIGVAPAGFYGRC